MTMEPANTATAGEDAFWRAGRDALLRRLAATSGGLSAVEAAARLRRCGPNLAVTSLRRGLPLKIALPDLNVTLMDSTAKKVQFCSEAIRSLRLAGARAVHGRAEEAGHLPQHREQYDVVIARAVAPLPTLVEYLLPLAKRGGRVVAYKGSAAHEEALCAEQALRTLGGRLSKLIPVEIPGLAETRVLVLIDKVAQTPDGYPRGRGLPRKHPLGCKPVEEDREEAV